LEGDFGFFKLKGFRFCKIKGILVLQN
jgi:hypothetical protein